MADAEDTAATDEHELIGQVIGDRYRIETMLGEGGMGAVFRARHLSLDRPVAIKVLHPRLFDDAHVRKRFEREALASSKLDHPGCVQVMDFGLATEPDLSETENGPEPEASMDPEVLEATRRGSTVGTPAYMAPEQRRGEAVDERADQFSFCVMVFRVLEGRPPFVGQTIMSLRESIAAGPPSAKAMPAWLESLVARDAVFFCMVKRH